MQTNPSFSLRKNCKGYIIILISKYFPTSTSIFTQKCFLSSGNFSKGNSHQTFCKVVSVFTYACPNLTECIDLICLNTFLSKLFAPVFAKISTTFKKRDPPLEKFLIQITGSMLYFPINLRKPQSLF